MIEEIRHSDRLFAIIVPGRFDRPGVTFVTPGELSQQLAYLHHAAGHTIDPHVHNPVRREVQLTQETLFIRSGKLRVDFFDDQQRYLESRVLESGDAILLIQGGHGFEVLEDVQMFEVKQGPYAGDQDKTRFQGTYPVELSYGSGSKFTR